MESLTVARPLVRKAQPRDQTPDAFKSEVPKYAITLPTVLLAATMLLPAALPAQQTITGQAAFADWNQQQPGVRRKITLAALPNPIPRRPSTTRPMLSHVPPTLGRSRPPASESRCMPAATQPPCSEQTTKR